MPSFETIFNHIPDLSYAPVFECKAIVHVPDPLLRKQFSENPGEGVLDDVERGSTFRI